MSTLARKLVVISAPYDRDGWHPEVCATVESSTREMFGGSGLPESYARVAPNPAGFPSGPASHLACRAILF